MSERERGSSRLGLLAADSHSWLWKASLICGTLSAPLGREPSRALRMHVAHTISPNKRLKHRMYVMVSPIDALVQRDSVVG